MITSLAQSIACFLVRNGIIQSENLDIYIYGFEVMISNAISIFIGIVLGLAFSQLIEIASFLFIFVLLRRFCGGYHAQTYLRCNIVFAINITIVLLILKFVERCSLYVHLIIVMLSTVFKKTKRSVIIVVSMVMLLLCVTAIPVSADSYTMSVGSTPTGFEIMTPGNHTVRFYPSSVAYKITFKTSPNGSTIATINSPAYAAGMPSSLTSTVNFPNQQVYWVVSTRSCTINIS